MSYAKSDETKYLIEAEEQLSKCFFADEVDIFSFDVDVLPTY